MKAMKSMLGIALGVVVLAQLTGCCCPCYVPDVPTVAAPRTKLTQARAVTEHATELVVAQAAPAAQKF